MSPASPTHTVPPEIESDLRRARRLEIWTIGWMLSIIAVLGTVLGSSQAMRTAWIEDMLSLIPAIVFLIAARYERKAPTPLFPHGYQRVHSLAFLISAVALSVFGMLLVIESALSLIRHERVVIPMVDLLGHRIWLGWLMVGALLYSVIPPMILGHMKLPLARRMEDEVLHTDAMMQKADWRTGLAGAAGVIGVGLGYWWADAAAAGIISFSIVKDGVKALRIATAELVDGAPRELGRLGVAEDAERLRKALEARYPGAEVRLRETGRYIHAQIHGVKPDAQVNPAELWPGPAERRWRFAQLSFVPPEKTEEA